MPGSPPDGLCDLLSRGLTRFGAQPLCYGIIADFEDAALFCRREQPDVIVAIPVQLRRLALTAPNLHPHTVLLSADYIAPPLKDTIQRVWHCRVYEHFGMTESGLGCAVETPGSPGMLCRNDILLEIENGEILITTLEREAMPLIRYRTGDLGRMNAFGNLEAVEGRVSFQNTGISINRLDQVLFSFDGILDYRACFDGVWLCIETLGEDRRAESAVRAAFPNLTITFSVAEEEASFHFSGKRRLDKE